MYALDTDLLLCTHNTASPFHTEAKNFMERMMNTRNAEGDLSVCLPGQVLTEFLHILTLSGVGGSLPLSDAVQLVQDYLVTGVMILHQQPTQTETFLNLVGLAAGRANMFDTALAATLKDYNIRGIYTLNTENFAVFSFLDSKNPLL